MFPSHSLITVTTAGTSVPLVALTQTDPSLRFGADASLEYDPTNTAGTKFYIGYGTTASDVSSSTYGWYLDSTIGTVNIALGNCHNDIDFASIRVDSNNSGAKLRMMPRQV